MCNLETFTDITGTIAFNTTTTISNTFPGQTTNLTFTGDAGQVVSLNSGNNTYPMLVDLLGRHSGTQTDVWFFQEQWLNPCCERGSQDESWVILFLPRWSYSDLYVQAHQPHGGQREQHEEMNEEGCSNTYT